MIDIKKEVRYIIKNKTCYILFLLLSSGVLFSQNYSFQDFYPTEETIPSYIYSITQDNSGLLWIADGSGLTRFNGFSFEKVPVPDSINGDFVTCLLNDGKNIWCGTNEGFLYYYDGKSFHSINQSGKPYSRINQFLISDDGSLWAPTNENGLIKIELKTKNLKQYVTEDPTAFKVIEFINDNEIIIGTNSGLHHYSFSKTGELKLIGTVDGLSGTSIKSIKRIRKEAGFYIATENNGIFKLIQENEKLVISPIKTEENDDLSGIQDVWEDLNNNLWLATFGKGLIRLNVQNQPDLSEVIYFNKKNGFVTDNVKTIFEDREGNIWTGNFGEGLTKVLPLAFSFIPLKDRTYGTSVFSIWPGRKYLWLGTEKGLLRINRKTMKIADFYGSDKGLPRDSIMTLFSGNDHDLWIGTSNNGVYLMDIETERIQRAFAEPDALKNSIVKITGKNEKIWIGTKKGLRFTDLSNDSASWFSINEGGLPHNIIHDLYLDSHDKLWITTKSNILSFIENFKITKIPLYSSKGIMVLEAVTEDASSTIWVASNGSGIFSIQADTIFNFTEKEGLLSNYCYSLTADLQKNIWITHKEGLSSLDISNFFIKDIDKFPGTPENIKLNPHSLAFDSDGSILFGTNQGILISVQNLMSKNTVAPLLNISSIKVNDKLIDYHEDIVLSPGNYKLQINYLGINLKSPSEVNYQYKLEGYNDWSNISHDTTVIFPQLTNGHYKFVLKASNEDGIVAESPLILDIKIQKSIWKIWWFYFLIFLFLSLINYLYLKKRERIILKEKQILEAKVIERTQEIQLQKDEIEEQRDLIKEKNSNITSSIVYASYIQDAIISSHSYFDKRFPENFILSKPKDIVSGDFYWIAEKRGKIIFTVADGTGHGVPGAFISLLGITFLDEIVNLLEINNAKEIITLLRERVIQTLTQKLNNMPTPDGMDIALCVLDKQNKTIQYTGAMNDLLLIQNGEMRLFKADRQSVCIPLTKKKEYSLHVINYQKGDMLYLFTDGYKDQFGGPNDKKYLARRFYDSLMEIHSESPLTQKEILEKRLREWMDDCPQTDDITVIGIRL